MAVIRQHAILPALRRHPGHGGGHTLVHLGTALPVLGMAVEQPQARRLRVGKIRIQQRLELCQGEGSPIVDLGLDHLQRVRQVGQPDKGTLHPVIGGAAVIDVTSAGDAVAGEDALQGFAAPLAALSARLVLLLHSRLHSGGKTLAVPLLEGDEVGRRVLALRRHLVQQQLTGVVVG
ncbi:MAG: hypothetical protein CME04_03020 [Gemmatimonadaceae bacterium]|nr:hypothetical protein [Gemmatimonadaceae bacterium]